MPNDSTTGGPLVPSLGGPIPLEGKELLRFLQGWVVGITGLPSNMAIPGWQAEPPVIPTEGTVWMSIRVAGKVTDTFPFAGYQSNPLTPYPPSPASPPYYMLEHQELNLLCSTYDLGIDGQADEVSSLLRSGAKLGQNRELLFLNLFNMGYVGDTTPAPVLFKQRWMYRVDLPICLRRRVVRQYPVKTLLEGVGTIHNERSNLSWDSVNHRPG